LGTLRWRIAHDHHHFSIAPRTREMPGFIDIKPFKAEDGERCTIVRWQDHETLAAWRNHPRHRVAQQNGRSKWYEFYHLEIAGVVRRELVRAAIGIDLDQRYASLRLRTAVISIPLSPEGSKNTRKSPQRRRKPVRGGLSFFT
jgi:heme-degrading monooxygenase HmoA